MCQLLFCLHCILASRALSLPTSLPPSLSHALSLPASRRDIRACDIHCLDYDAFDFDGATNVTDVNIQANLFAALPEELLWNMTSLLRFYARTLKFLHGSGVPEKFFQGLNRLELIYFSDSTVGLSGGLPDNIFKGLANLDQLSLTTCGLTNVPDMSGLTVRFSICGHIPNCCHFILL